MNEELEEGISFSNVVNVFYGDYGPFSSISTSSTTSTIWYVDCNNNNPGLWGGRYWGQGTQIDPLLKRFYLLVE